MNTTTQFRVGVLTLTGVGVLATVGSLGLGLGSLSSPGPGLWPFTVGLLIVVSGVALLIEGDQGTTELIDRKILIVLAAAASLAVYAALFENQGFEIPTIALFILWMKGFGRESWRVTLVAAVLVTVALHLLFVEALGVSLPHRF